MAKLRPRARIIRTIGDQLISGPDAALIELVKNSFDADSPSVDIAIHPKGNAEPRGLIKVSDKGHGMSKLDVIGRWFEPATDDKVIRRISPGGRVMLGAKGIGRFAAARLGRSTTVESVYSESGSRSLVVVDIDWDLFNSTRYLDEVEIDVEEKTLPANDPRPAGVEISIRDLRDQWTKKALEGLIRELRRVVSPATTREKGFSIRLDVTAFSKDQCGFDGPELLAQNNYYNALAEVDGGAEIDPQLIRPFSLEEHADYSLKGQFDEQGEFTGSFLIQRGDGQSQEIDVSPPAISAEEKGCGQFELQINVYDRESEALENLFARMGLELNRIGLLNARRILTDNAGISIFRNNFRIRPYGEPENDWLELERQRVQDPSRKLGISQVSGLVRVGDEKSSGLIERSSREGLEHTPEFERLKTLIKGVLIHVEQRRFEFRQKAGLSRKIPGNLDNLRQAASLRRVAQVAMRLPKEYREKVEEAINQDSAELAEELKQIDSYQQILQSRAALGLVLAEVLHEGRRILNPVASSAKAIIDGKDWILEHSPRGEVYRKQFPDNAETVFKGAIDMGKLFKKLDPISGRKRGRPARIPLRDALQRSLDLFKDAISRSVILVNVECDDSLLAYGYEDDLQAAFMNICDNALFWLSARDAPRIINITVNDEEQNICISISNNGPRIAPSYIPRLFDAGFTLKSEGTGLGLAIAREAMKRSKGEVSFNENESETTFIIRVPRFDGRN